MSASNAGPAAAGTVPSVAVAHVIVPIGSRSSAEVALGPAAELARRFGAQLHLLSIAIERAEAETMARRLTVLASGFGAVVETRVDADVPTRILQVARSFRPALVCMASHGRGRLAEAALGSHTTGVIAGTSIPVLLAGPRLDPERRIADGPVLACVDGSEPSEESLPVAAAWALSLGVPLRIVTVYPPAPAIDARHSGRRIHPPGRYPELYIDALVETWRHPELVVTGQAIRNERPLGDALASALEAAPGGLLVVSTHARTGLQRLALGSDAAAIVRSSPLPVLVVPRHDR